MAVSRVLIASLLISLLLFHVVEALEEDNINMGPTPPTINCKVACWGRCWKASRYKRCMRACGSCCGKCNCVPPGTYGNEGVCPCYANIRTNRGKHKCP